MDVADVYIIAVKHCIEHEKSLHMLCTSRATSPSTLDLPSWVPDLGYRSREFFPQLVYFESRPKDRSLFPGPEIHPHPERRCIALGGIALGTVVEFESHFQSVEDYDSQWCDIDYSLWIGATNVNQPASRNVGLFCLPEILDKPFVQTPYPLQYDRNQPSFGKYYSGHRRSSHWVSEGAQDDDIVCLL